MSTGVLHQASPVVASYILHTYSTLKTRKLTLVQSTALNSDFTSFTCSHVQSSTQFYCRCRLLSSHSGYRAVPSLQRDCSVLSSLQSTPTPPPPLLIPGTYVSYQFPILYNSVFLRMFYDWNNTICNLLRWIFSFIIMSLIFI